MGSMDSYSKAAVERAMKVQEVILRALAKKITWWQAAEIIGISDRQMRRGMNVMRSSAMTGCSTDGAADPRPSEFRWRRNRYQLAILEQPEIRKGIEEQTALDRIGEVQDIANLACLLASGQSQWVTCQYIAAAGGFRL